MFRRPSKKRQRLPAKRSLGRLSRLEKLESRQLMAADSIGVTPFDTGEFLLGTVTVTPVFLESNGEIDVESQDWSAEEIDEMLVKIGGGVNWWSDTLDTLGTVHSLDFVIDDTFAREPYQTPFEPIDRPTSAINDYIGGFVTELGYGDARTIEDAVQRFNHDQRTKHATDWAFTIFVADSSDDADGLFASGGNFAAAFAYAGGLFMVTPSTRPASTIAHEMGHIFWARDEYPGVGSWSDRRGYYDTQNLNASDNPMPGFTQEVSIMRGGVPLTSAFNAHVSPPSTLAMVGWQDSDGDGIFDLADVPLELSGIGYFDAASQMYHFTGEASAIPLRNQNSSGVQSDITLNRVDELQYRLDDGDWTTAATPDSQLASLEIAFPITADFTTIEFRAIDTVTGVVSPIVAGTPAWAAISASSVGGVAFLDDDGDGIKSVSEDTLAGAVVSIRNADGSSIMTGQIAASNFDEGSIDDPFRDGIRLSSDGAQYDSRVGSFPLSSSNGRQVFQSFDQQRTRWTERFTSAVSLMAEFEAPVGEVTVSLIGLDEASYGRVEAFDAAGNLIDRQTTDIIAANESRQVVVTDAGARIAGIRVFGHAGSGVAIDEIRYGGNHQTLISESGAWQFPNLADGDYIIDVVPDRLIYSLGDQPITVSVVGGTSSLIQAAALRVDSPRHNTVLPADVNGERGVTAGDALAVINDLGRNQARILTADETEGPNIDVNNDGMVSPLDALLVINMLSRRDAGGEGETAVNLQVASATATSIGSPVLSSSVTPTKFGISENPAKSRTSQWSAYLESSSNNGRMFNFDGDNAVDQSGIRFGTDTTRQDRHADLIDEALAMIKVDFSEPLDDSAV